MPFQAQMYGRTLTQLQQDLSALTIDELRAYLASITNAFGAEIVPTFALANVAITGAPLTSKTYVRDEWLDLTRAGSTKGATAIATGAVGSAPRVALSLPAAATVRALVYGLVVSTSALTEVQGWIEHTDPLGGTSSARIVTPLTIRHALRPGAGAPAAQIVTDAGTGVGTVAGPTFPPLVRTAPANSPENMEPESQGFVAELAPGSSLVVTTADVNLTLKANFLWAEVPASY